MTIKPAIRAALWMIPGAVFMLLLVLIVDHFQKGQNPGEQLAIKAGRVDLVSRMQFGLSSAAEAEKSAVLAITDQESVMYADRARAAAAQVDRERAELEGLLTTGGTQEEKSLLVQFSQAFVEFQLIDKELLGLAVKNTNLKASSLAFGPAADALRDTEDALSRLVAANAGSPSVKKVMLLAFGVQTGALRIQTLLAPHIAEESDEKMGGLEALMVKDDELVKKDLEDLKAVPDLRDRADLATAASSFVRYDKIRSQILALSRENTNVRSLALSLNRKRKVTLLCQDALNALKQAILKEPVRGIDYPAVARPR